jgi:hypothetical protein
MTHRIWGIERARLSGPVAERREKVGLRRNGANRQIAVRTDYHRHHCLPASGQGRIGCFAQKSPIQCRNHLASRGILNKPFGGKRSSAANAWTPSPLILTKCA